MRHTGDRDRGLSRAGWECAKDVPNVAVFFLSEAAGGGLALGRRCVARAWFNATCESLSVFMGLVIGVAGREAIRGC